MSLKLTIWFLFFQSLLTSLKNDEERLRKLINFVKPFELPEIKAPPEKPETFEEETPPKKPKLEEQHSSSSKIDNSSQEDTDHKLVDAGSKRLLHFYGLY